MSAPDKIYVREFAEGLSQIWSGIRATETSATVQHEYIRKDVVKHIIRGARGPQDALNKIESL